LNIHVITVRWRPKAIGVVGLAEVDLSDVGIRLYEVAITCGADTPPRADLPRRPAYDMDGQPIVGRDMKLIAFRKPDLAVEFSKSVIAQVELLYPGRLTGGAA
jgi:hypothetical protein